MRYYHLSILALSGFVTSFVAHIVATNLPSYAEVTGAGALMIGLLIGIYDLAELFAKPFAGFVADQRGMKGTLLVGLGVFIFGSFLFLIISPTSAGRGTVRPGARCGCAFNGLHFARRKALHTRPRPSVWNLQRDQRRRLRDLTCTWGLYCASRELRDDFCGVWCYRLVLDAPQIVPAARPGTSRRAFGGCRWNYPCPDPL